MHQRIVKIRRFMDSSYKIISSTIGSKSPIVFSMGELDRKKRAARINEIFLDVKALEVIAASKAWRWSFITLTASPEYHSNPAEGKDSYDSELTANSANQSIAKDWKDIRGYLKERLIKPGESYFGVRVTEVHEDGCPHWHILMFHEPDVFECLYEAVARAYEGRSGAYFEKNKDQIIRVGKEDGDGVAAPSSYIFSYLAFALKYEASEEANYSTPNRYRCALKAMRARQYQFFGVKGGKGKLRALAQVRGKPNVPCNIKKMAETMFVDALLEGGGAESESLRRKKQLDARVRFYQGEADLLSFETEEYTNFYGEGVKRILAIKHTSDSEAVQIGGLCEDISKSEVEVLLASGLHTNA